jgi:hypothetical protein
VLASTARAKQLDSVPVFLRSVAFRTRRFGSFDAFSPVVPIGESTSVSARCGCRVRTCRCCTRGHRRGAGAGHRLRRGGDHLAETGLCAHGEQETLIQNGETEIRGGLPVNTDGGCIANGEPVGASGLRQVHEVALQLRRRAGERQVPGNPQTGFIQVYGAPGVSACTVLTR